PIRVYFFQHSFPGSVVGTAGVRERQPSEAIERLLSFLSFPPSSSDATCASEVDDFPSLMGYSSSFRERGTFRAGFEDGECRGDAGGESPKAQRVLGFQVQNPFRIA